MRQAPPDRQPEQLPDQLFIWDGLLLLIAAKLHNRPHRHLALSLLISDSKFDLRLQDRTECCQLALVGPDVVQSLNAKTPVTIVHVDPDHELSRLLFTALDNADVLIPQPTPSTTIQKALSPSRLRNLDCGSIRNILCDALTASFDLHPLESAPDSRIAQLCRRLRSQAPEVPTVAAIAAEMQLSESRLAHLFRQQMGVALKRFLMHLRLQHAMRAWGPGCSFSEIAVDAGFYDQAHLIRTARGMLDFLPSLLADPSRIELNHCETAETRPLSPAASRLRDRTI